MKRRIEPNDLGPYHPAKSGTPLPPLPILGEGEDLQRFLESDRLTELREDGIYILEENRVEDARQVIRALKGVQKI